MKDSVILRTPDKGQFWFRHVWIKRDPPVYTPTKKWPRWNLSANPLSTFVSPNSWTGDWLFCPCEGRVFVQLHSPSKNVEAQKEQEKEKRETPTAQMVKRKKQVFLDWNSNLSLGILFGGKIAFCEGICSGIYLCCVEYELRMGQKKMGFIPEQSEKCLKPTLNWNRAYPEQESQLRFSVCWLRISIVMRKWLPQQPNCSYVMYL